MARAPPDGYRARGATCPWKDSLLECKARVVSGTESLSQRRGACLEGGVEEDLGESVGSAEVCLCGENQVQPVKQWKAFQVQLYFNLSL